MSSIENFGPHYLGFDTECAFRFYELVRSSLPDASFPKQAKNVSGLLEIAEEIDVFVFDAFGVLNVGGTAINGAAECVSKLREMGKSVFVLTNAATYQSHKNVEKYHRLGIPFADDEVISSRMGAALHVASTGIKRWGVMGRDDSDPSDFGVETRILRETQEDYDWAEAFLLLTTWQWNQERQALIETSMRKKKRPVVVANPDVIAPLEKRFSTEPGFTGHRLARLFQAEVAFHGKPFPSVFNLVMQKLPKTQELSRIAMIGDTLHTDVLGGAANGWSTVLVSDHGLFRDGGVANYIAASGIIPNYIVPSI